MDSQSKWEYNWIRPDGKLQWESGDTFTNWRNIEDSFKGWKSLFDEGWILLLRKCGENE